MKRRRVYLLETFYYIDYNMTISSCVECDSDICKELFRVGNYFCSIEEAEDVLSQFKNILLNVNKETH